MTLDFGLRLGTGKSVKTMVAFLDIQGGLNNVDTSAIVPALSSLNIEISLGELINQMLAGILIQSWASVLQEDLSEGGRHKAVFYLPFCGTSKQMSY